LLLSSAGIAAYLFTYQTGSLTQIAAFVALGFGVGAAMTAASTSIMLNAPEDRAGMAASIEEVSFELGGAIGIAVLGSLMSAVYTASFIPLAGLTITDKARDGIDQALLAAETLPPEAASSLLHLANTAFDHAFVIVLIAASGALCAAAFAIAIAARRKVAADGNFEK
jgi:DHA2 family multidrug resistance protein-like MFS transporter